MSGTSMLLPRIWLLRNARRLATTGSQCAKPRAGPRKLYNRSHEADCWVLALTAAQVTMAVIGTW